MRIINVTSLNFAMVLILFSAASASDRDSANRLSTLPITAQANISAALGKDISDYRASEEGGGFEVSNRHHNLFADFTASGVNIRSGPAHWRMRFSGYGYGNVLRAAKTAAPEAAFNRVEYRRGAVTEWYVNGPVGLEQGFTVMEPPGQAHGRPLTITLALSGDLTATSDENGKDLVLSDKDAQPMLRYTGLTAYDATGMELQTRLAVDDDQLIITVQDTGAQYPLQIDPFVQLAKLTASDGHVGDNFGSGVSLSGKTLVVGAPYANSGRGTVYVFVEPAGGWRTTSTFKAKLIASDGAGRNFFGASVSISGDTVVAGAYNATVNGNSGQGAAYVFVKPASGWINMPQTAKLTSSDGKAGDLFGSSVSIDGNTVVIGAPIATANHSAQQGTAYVFVKPAGGWKTSSKFNARLTSSTVSANKDLGNSVSVNGNTVLAGARFDYVGSSFAGSAYVFVQPTTGWKSMTETALLTASDGTGSANFGYSVAMTGNTAVIGATDAQVGSSFPGAAYVFVKPAGGWTTTIETAKLTASDGRQNAFLGFSVAITGNTIVAGAPYTGSSQFGNAYVFVMPAGGWTNMTETQKLTAKNESAYERFGSSMSMSGQTFAVSSPGASSNQGAAYIWGQGRNEDYGVSGGNVKDPCCSAGTLGAMVVKGGTEYVLSADHIFGLPLSSSQNSARVGDGITQPGLGDNRCKPGFIVANFSLAPKLDTGVDAAIAKVIPGALSSSGEIQNIGIPANTTTTAIVGLEVAKQGRTTGLTCGTVTGVNMKIRVGYTGKPCTTHFYVTFENQVVIQAASGAFSLPGDSGSLIVSSHSAEATGLLFAGQNGFTWANPIADVLSKLGGATIGGSNTHPVSGCTATSGDGSEVEREILLPQSEQLRALEVKNANSDRILQDPAVIAIGVGASEMDQTRGAVVIFLREGQPHQPIPREIDGVPTRIFFTGPVIANTDDRCPNEIPPQLKP